MTSALTEADEKPPLKYGAEYAAVNEGAIFELVFVVESVNSPPTKELRLADPSKMAFPVAEPLPVIEPTKPPFLKFSERKHFKSKQIDDE